MALTLTLTIGGTPDDWDIEAATMVVDAHNAQLLAADPEAVTLPVSPVGDLATSYETVLKARIVLAHNRYKKQAADAALEQSEAEERWRISTAAQRAAALGQLEPLP